MRIKLNNIKPQFKVSETSEIWGSDTVFISGQYYRVTAGSGKGKSTFIHYIYGYRTDYTGSLEIDTRDIKTFNTNELAGLREKDFSIVFQDLKLINHLTVMENIQLNTSEKASQIDEYLRILDIPEYKDKPVKQLSWGQKQRTAIIRAICKPFTMLLLDEPFSHIDDENAGKAALLIMEKVKSNNAGLIITSLGSENHFRENLTNYVL